MSACHLSGVQTPATRCPHANASLFRNIVRLNNLSSTSASRMRVIVKAEDPQAAQLRALEEAMKNPQVAAQVKSMEEAMKKPEVQNQMAQMQALMSSPQYMQRMAELREDPELKPIFDAIREGGMPAMMKYMNDPAFLSKIGEKMGDIESMMASAPQPTPAVAPPPTVNNILDAAKYGDIEAIEDYMAIGKGEFKDENDRTALHYAVAYDQSEAVKTLLDNGANVAAVDNAENTALHYAAGYGRGEAVRALVKAGSDTRVKNSDGATPADLVRAEPRNPLNNDASIMSLLS